jgi:hypothetical protein
MTTRNYATRKQDGNSTTHHDHSAADDLTDSISLQAVQRALNKSDGETLTPDTMMQLQRTIGNRAVLQLMRQNAQPAAKIPVSRSGTGSVIQRETGDDPITKRLLEYVQNMGEKEKVRELALHLLTAIEYMEKHKNKKAYDLLKDKGIAGSFNYDIKTVGKVVFGMIDEKTKKKPEEIEQEVVEAAGKGKHSPPGRINEKSLEDMSGSLKLPHVEYYPNCWDTSGKTGDGMKPEMLTPANNEMIAGYILPVMLEEWIHMFQHMSNSVLSKGVADFQKSPIFQQHQTGFVGDWNINEVDIYGVYRDLGWKHLLDVFRSRYPERMAYESFINPGFAKENPGSNSAPGSNENTKTGAETKKEEEEDVFKNFYSDHRLRKDDGKNAPTSDKNNEAKAREDDLKGRQNNVTEEKEKEGEEQK